jgi:hypothetical protein
MNRFQNTHIFWGLEVGRPKSILYDRKMFFTSVESFTVITFQTLFTYAPICLYIYTRWFKYDRDKLSLVYTQRVLVIFEPPCIYICTKKKKPFDA